MLANLFFRLFSELVAVEMLLSSPSYSDCNNTDIVHTEIITKYCKIYSSQQHKYEGGWEATLGSP